MKKTEFDFNKDSRVFEFTNDSITLCIDEENMSEEVLLCAEKIKNSYAKKIKSISEHLSANEDFLEIFGDISAEEIADKLGKPSINIFDANSGVLTYCEHEFDDEHLIDIEFIDALEKIDLISIDG